MKPDRGGIMISISREDSIYKLLSSYPDIKEVMIELGFTDIVKPGMLQSVGRIMNLQKGSNMKNLDMNLIKETFKKYGYEVV